MPDPNETRRDDTPIPLIGKFIVGHAMWGTAKSSTVKEALNMMGPDDRQLAVLVYIAQLLERLVAQKEGE